MVALIFLTGGTLRLESFPQYNAFETHSCSCVINSSVLLLSSIRSHCMDLLVCLFNHWRTFGLSAIFGGYEEVLIHSCTVFDVNITFHFSKVNTQEWDCWITWKITFNFMRNGQFSWVVFPFCIPLSNVWQNQLLNILTSICSFFKFSHSTRLCPNIHCDFNLYFPSD